MQRVLLAFLCCAAVAAIGYWVWMDPTLLEEKSGRFAFPLLVGDGLWLVALSALLAVPGWYRLGLGLWILAVAAAGGLIVFGMHYAAFAKQVWQGPAMIAGFIVFAFIAELTRKRLADAGSGAA